MDKRIIKTNHQLYEALGKLLNEKSYNKITIEDLLKESKVSRSTFYAHFKTKDEVLISITTMIINHVFSHSLKEETTHDFSKASIFDYTHLVTHTLYHLHDEKKLIEAILASESKDIFLRDLRKEISPIAAKALDLGVVRTKDVPRDLRIAELVENFVISIKYWFGNDCAETPETLTNYFFSMNK
ncbi:MAG: TetR/AcrR family transcriptional regulator [Clostridia bacterium]|nr:TetR/AcrR family transcriptional regulator [Clostridia bacterium]